MKRASCVLVLCALAVLGCSSQNKDTAPAQSGAQPNVAEPAAPAAQPPPAAAATQAAAQAEPARAVIDTLMRGHFRQATEAREALIRGDMQGAKQAMQWLTEHQETEAIPQGFLPMYSAMQASAKKFGQATTLREAGVALAATLTKCADCHRSAQRGPKFGLPPLPAGTDGKSHMRRHLWVAQRMWEGLVDGSETTFPEAAKVLAAEHWNTDVLALKGNTNETVAQNLDKYIHELSAEAPQATTPDARGELYGHFLATCATCHRLLGRGPATPALQPAATQPGAK